MKHCKEEREKKENMKKCGEKFARFKFMLYLCTAFERKRFGKQNKPGKEVWVSG